MARAFVIRPFGEKQDSKGNKLNFDVVHEKLIGPALQAVELGGGTTGEIVDSGNIREDMFKLILEADVVVADITVHNANVFYELGIRHALRKKRTVMIRAEGLKDATPFDLLTDRYTSYPDADPAVALEKLTAAIQASLDSDRETDSPVFAMMEGLPEADAERVNLVPLDFREEVERARTARAAGWLGLLAEEVRHQRFEWPGLKLVAKAQWKLEDWNGARDSWQAIADVYPDDIDANLALANIYERLYRADKTAATLASSDQAIMRILKQKDLPRNLRAEAEGLRGRNEKTRWRQRVEAETDLAKRREVAMNRRLIGSYEAYRRAYFQDLNSYWPGLAALQMGTILQALRDVPSWPDAFDTDQRADAFKVELENQVADLHHLVPAAVRAHLESTPEPDTWAKISRADVRFLTSDRPQRVIQGYEQAVPLDDPFAWNATKGQLELFCHLGVKPDIAAAVIREIDQRVEKKPQHKAVHLVVMGGHCVDAATCGEPRFPPTSEAKAKELLADALRGVQDEFKDTHEVRVLASAAPGADILAHEVCQEMGIPSTICLPMPQAAFAANVFPGLNAWRSRFLKLVKADMATRSLSDRPGLPRWLRGSETDPWDRGNRWVMSMAKASTVDRVSLIVLWDGKRGGEGGTAQMVALAEQAGTIDVIVIDSNTLLAAAAGSA